MTTPLPGELLAPDAAWSAIEAGGTWRVLVSSAWRLVGTLDDSRIPADTRTALGAVSRALMQNRRSWSAAVLVVVPPAGRPYVRLASTGH